MHFDHLSKPPFNLDREAIAWVETQFRTLSPEHKVAQLFNLRSQGMDETELARLRRFRPGGHSGGSTDRSIPAPQVHATTSSGCSVSAAALPAIIISPLG